MPSTPECDYRSALIEAIALIGKQDGGAGSATDHTDHESNSHQKSSWKRYGALPPKLECVAILKVLRSQAKQQKQQQAPCNADEQKTQAN